MTLYKNLNGNSNVKSYEIFTDSIQVEFKTGRYRNYLYNEQRPGIVILNQMKKLAVQGYGLNSYISTTVGSNYFKKW